MTETAPLRTTEKTRTAVRTLQTLFFVLETSFVIILLIWWLSSASARQSKSLWVFFFYSFPAECFIAAVPHETAVVYFGKFYSPLVVTLVAVAGTILAEILNYSVFRFMTDFRSFKKLAQTRTVQKMVRLFEKAPFAALWIAGFAPLPFFPFRILVVLARYPLSLYIAAVILSRFPRFYLLGLAGHAFKISDSLLLLLTLLLILVTNIPLMGRFLKKKTVAKTP